MKLNDKTQKQLYAFFVGLFTINVLVTLWNVRENHKLRELQRKLAEQQLSEVNKKQQEEINS